MPITTANGTTYSDDQVKSFFASSPSNDAIASQAASLGLSADQVSQAAKIAGKDWSTSDVTHWAGDNGYDFGGANGGAQKSTATSTPGGMSIGGTYYTPTQVKSFIAGGGDPTQWAQQHGITNLDQIHALATQARQIAGVSAPTGDAALQAAFKQYQQYSPNGKYANNFQGWVNDLNPEVASAMRAGTYSGQLGATATSDFAPGGIYGPESQFYGKAGYGSGLGPRGMGDLGGGWSGGPTASTGATGSVGGTGTGTGSGTTSTGSNGGIIGSVQSSSSGGNGGTVPWVVTPDQTVEGRINGIIKGNSGIIQQARANALESMNGRGLLNSSLAQTASDAAAYQAAIPIAQADAATTAKAAGYNADIQNQFSTNAMNRTSQMDIAKLNADTQKAIASMNNEQQLRAQQFTLANQTLLNTNSNAAQAFNTAMSAINNIQMNDKMDATAKTQATANVWHSLQQQLAVLGGISGLNLGSQLSFANYPGFDSNGNWVGFADAPSAPTTTTPTTTPSVDRSGA